MRCFPVVILTLCLTAFGSVAARAQDAPATQPLTPTQARHEAFFRASFVDAYETVGRKNPKWDENARKVLALAVQRWMAPQPDPDVDWQIRVFGDEAFKAGCDDPAVLYNVLRANMTLNTNIDPALLTLLDRRLPSSKYAPFIKIFAWVRLTAFHWRANVDAKKWSEHVLQGVYDNIPGLLSEKDLTQYVTADVCADLTDFGVTLDGDRKPMIDKIYDIMTKAQPDSPIPDLFKSVAYEKYAWDARGNGFAATVNDASWRPFGERLAVAKDACDASLAKDAHFAPAAVQMTGVQLGEDVDRAEMEKYFQRAIADDPDSYAAYQDKLYYLTPKWHGETNDQLEFGRACLATKQWDDRIPFLLLQSQKNMVEGRFWALCTNTAMAADRQNAWDTALAELYAAQPDTWRDVQTLYQDYLAHNPKAVTERINYAKAAMVANLPKIAKEQLDYVDAHADPVFKDLIAQPELRAAMRAALDKASAVNPAP